MKRKLSSTRKPRKQKKFLPANERYALAAIYGPNWTRMNEQVLTAALESIRSK